MESVERTIERNTLDATMMESIVRGSISITEGVPMVKERRDFGNHVGYLVATQKYKLR